MSLINRMLRDLDKRHASQGGTAAPAGGLSAHMRPVPARALASDFFWRTMAMAMLFARGWVAWVVWQLTPHPVVTDLAYKASPGKISTPTDAASSRSGSAQGPHAAAVLPAPAPAPASTAPSPSPEDTALKTPQTPLAQTERVNVDMLRLATELTTPIPRRSSRLSSSRSAPKNPAKASGKSAPRAVEVVASGKIDRRSNTTQRDRAENEFRRAVNLVNQGRIAEGMEAFHSALALDPAHETARQTLVALLLEGKRVNEAAALLQEGLALNGENTGFAMLLARILVESNDIQTALFVLQRHAAPPDRNPDFHAFAAALDQRLDRHTEAIEQYQAALRLAPSAGIWGMGMGISYQAVGQSKEALEAFTRAKSAGNLAPDLLAFVDQRLRQLQ
ncbi:MAG TPA: tetratricopeptide repeat protein [Burkholderiales bacterium]